jgi:hypothetical protein
MSAPVLQFKRGAFANLPGLRAGEPALTTDSYDLYVGIDSTTNGNKFFGSHRYWTKETSTTGSGVRFVERSDSGSNYIEIKAPNTALAGDVTYVLPGIQGNASSVLTNDGSGNLTWSSGSDSPVFTGISTFSDTTNNVLGNENTGSVQLDGGMGIAKNLTVKENLHVGGYSEFVGVVTFRGGTINLGDGNTDDINVAGEFISSLNPNSDNTYDIGDAGNSKRWRNASFSGIGTFSTGVVADGINIGITGTTEIDTSSGTLTLDSAGGQVVIDDNLSVTGVSTFTGAIDANGGLDVSGGETVLSSATVSDLTAGRVVLAGTSGSLEGSANLTFSAGGLTVGSGGVNVTGVSTFSTDVVVGGDLQVTGNDIKSSTGAVAITLSDNDITVADDLTVQGNLYVNGSTTQVSTSSLTVEDRTIDLGIVNGSTPSSNTTWDLGVLFNYYTSGSAKKSAVVWEHSDSRFKFASVLGSDTNGTDANTPQLTVTTFAPIEIGSLWVNDCAGQSQVISCTGSERFLENITIDAGTF